MKRVFFTALFLMFLSAQGFAITNPNEKLADPALEARAVALTQNLRCVVCQNESIEASHADIARDLRTLVRKQIAEGKTDAAIMDYLHARYGDYIFLKPPVAPRTYLLWLMPALIFGIGATLALPSLKRRRRK